MKNFIFENPTKVIFGKGTIATIGSEVKNSGLKKVIILAGGGSIKKNGVYDQMIASLKASNIDYVEAWGIQANPILSKVNEIIDIAKKEKIDGIIAVGGGSVIDSAKAVALGYYLDNIWDVLSQQKVAEKALPIFTVLTISATASEMNGNFVITNKETKQKWFANSLLAYPKVAIIDPEVQQTLPWKQTVNGALDAISHTMEYYFCDQENIITIELNKALMQTIIKMVDRLQIDKDDYVARGNLAWSATLGLNGMTAVGSGFGDFACHIMEHALSALNDKVDHGAGLGVVTPAWVEYMYSKQPEKFVNWPEVWGANSVPEAIENMKKKIASWGHPTTLKELGFTETDIPVIVEKILETGPCGFDSKLNKEDLIKILQLAL